MLNEEKTPRILYLEKLSFKTGKEIKIVSYIQKLKEIINTRLSLQEICQESPKEMCYGVSHGETNE